MKRILVILLMSMMIMALLVAGCGGEESTSAQAGSTPAEGDDGTVHELTYALFQPEVAAMSAVNTAFAQEIENRSNGRVKITIYAGGSLLGAAGIYQGVLDGVADMGNGVSSYDPSAFPFTSIAELPTAAESGWAVSNALHDFMEEYHPKEWSSVHLLTTVGTAGDFQALCMGKKRLQTIDDWAGVSIRTNHADIVQAMGGTVKDIPMADVYDGLSKGVVDGVMGTAEPLKSWRLGEVCDYVTINPAPVQPSVLWYNVMNLDTWESLPADIQEVINEVSREYSAKIGLAWDDQGIEGINFAVEQGKTIDLIPDEEAAKWTEAVLPVVEKRIDNLAKESGLPPEEIEAAWTYFQERVDYWNGQQAANNITPVIERAKQAVGQ